MSPTGTPFNDGTTEPASTTGSAARDSAIGGTTAEAGPTADPAVATAIATTATRAPIIWPSVVNRMPHGTPCSLEHAIIADASVRKSARAVQLAEELDNGGRCLRDRARVERWLRVVLDPELH